MNVSSVVSPMRLKIERELAMVFDRQQVNISINLRVQHQIMIYDVFAQSIRVRQYSLQFGA